MRSKKTVKGSDGLQSEKSGDTQSERYESDKILSGEIRSKKTLKGMMSITDCTKDNNLRTMGMNISNLKLDNQV
uniref:Uncharacterized protein n=1 Tax=Oryza meridionalis TaxID=40149 RepID=A0A0E0EQF0_9ORYZ